MTREQIQKHVRKKHGPQIAEERRRLRQLGDCDRSVCTWPWTCRIAVELNIARGEEFDILMDVIDDMF